MLNTLSSFGHQGYDDRMSLGKKLANFILGAPEKRAEISLELAMRALKKGDLITAEYHIKKALKNNPASSAAHGALGSLLIVKGDLAGAKGAFSRALELGERSAVLLSNLGVVLRGLGETAEAVKLHEEALERSPGDCETILNAVASFVTVREYARATGLLRRALAVDPGNPKAHFYLASFPGAESNEAEFLEHLEFASFDRNLAPDIAFFKGRHLLISGRTEEGGALVTEAFRSRPEYFDLVDTDERHRAIRDSELYKKLRAERPKQMFAAITAAEASADSARLKAGEKKQLVVLVFVGSRDQAAAMASQCLDAAGWKNYSLDEIRAASKQQLATLSRAAQSGWEMAERDGAHIFVF